MVDSADALELNEEIRYEEVQKVVDLARNGKAVGIDSIPNEALKNAKVINLLYVLFHTLFENGQIPTVWRNSIIHPIPKGSTKVIRPLLFRGLALQSCIYKLYSAIINRRITRHLEENRLVEDQQNGFRAGRSCNQHVFTLCKILQSRLNQDRSTHLCFIDFRKAFDYLDRDLMLSRLVEVGVRGKIYRAIQESYKVMLNAVRINGETGRWFDTSQGTKQGNVISPTIFSVYVNGLLKELKQSKVGITVQGNMVTALAYVDDIVLMALTQAGLQTLLGIVERWCYKWRLSVNMDKTKVMHVRKKSVRETQYDFVYKGQKLDKVGVYCYMGFSVDSDLCMTEGCDSLTKSGERALGALISKVKTINDVGYKTFEKLYKTCVIPVLDYCGGILGINPEAQWKFEKMDIVNERAQRFYLGVSRHAPKAGYGGDMPLEPGLDRWLVDTVRFYNSLLKVPEDRLVCKIFKASRYANGTSWVNSLKTHLTRLGFEREWAEQKPVDLRLLEDKLRQKQDELWKQEVAKKRKLQTYQIIQLEQKTASHALCFLPKRQRSLIQNLCIGTLPLMIEKGRYSGKPVDERVCMVCDSGEVEDEYYLLFKCKVYGCLRKPWLEKQCLDPDKNSKQDNLKMAFDKPYLLGNYLKGVMKLHEEISRSKAVANRS